MNYNGLRFLPDCLKSIRAADYPNFVITLVDNASTDGSIEWLENNYPDITIIKLKENLGITGGNNAGMRWCLENGCDWIMLLNNDTVVEPDFLTKLIAHASPNLLIMPRIYFFDDKSRLNNHFGSFDYLRGVHKDIFYNKQDTVMSEAVQEGTMGNTCALLFSRHVPELIGLQDEQYFIYFDDTDFITRAVRHGYRVIYAPDSIIYHKESSSSGGGSSPLSVYYNTRNRLYFMFKHQRNPIALGFFLCYFTMTRLVWAVLLLSRGDKRLLRVMYNAMEDYSRGRMGKADAARFMSQVSSVSK